MRKSNSLKNLVWMAMIFVAMCVFVSCDPDDVTGHDNNSNAVMSVTVKPDTTKHDPVYGDSSWTSLIDLVIRLDWQYFKNDTLVDSLKNSTNVAAQIERDQEKIQTNVARLNNLGITAGQVVESRDGKMNYVFRQAMTDLDGQIYNGLFTSGYASLKDLQNVHGKLVGFQTTGFRNIPQPTPEDMDTLVITRVGWKAIFEVENGKNLAGQTFEIALDSTDHFRYIPKDAPQIVDRKPFQYKELGIWKSTWTFGYHYYWDNGTVTGDSMQVVLNGSYETIELKDKVVGNLTDYSHADDSLKFKERTAAYSDDPRVKKFDNRYEKESYATNGNEDDKFRTLFAITVQDATAEFCDTTWTLPADEVAMTTTRNIFADEDSDKEGHTMVRFTDTESAKYADGKGDNTVALKETCKLYLKVEDPEIIHEGWDKFDFEKDAKEYEDRVEYFLKWIREYSTGKKTSQEVKVVIERNADGSTYTITVENPQREIGEVSEEVPTYIARTESSSDIVINYDWKTSSFELPNVFDGNKTENDIATFVDPTNVKVTKKNSKGEDVEISLPSFEHQLTSTVSELEKVSESDELVEYTYTRTWSWASTQCTSTAKSYGFINKVPDGGSGEPDFDLEIGSIFATVSRPSNRDASDITAYTYLLVSKDGKKCLPLGFYNGVITVDDNNGIVDYVPGMNSACYVKNENKVVATTATLANGIIKYKDANGNMVDGGMFLTWQGAGFNDRGNDYLNHTGKYAPKAEKKGNVYVVTFEGTNVSYTFKGWDVK